MTPLAVLIVSRETFVLKLKYFLPAKACPSFSERSKYVTASVFVAGVHPSPSIAKIMFMKAHLLPAVMEGDPSGFVNMSFVDVRLLLSFSDFSGILFQFDLRGLSIQGMINYESSGVGALGLSRFWRWLLRSGLKPLQTLLDGLPHELRPALTQVQARFIQRNQLVR